MPRLNFRFTTAEIDPAKRRGLLSRQKLGKYKLNPTRIFGDIHELPGPAYCFLTGQHATQDHADILVAGFCCKNLSSLNGKKVPFVGGSGISASTYEGVRRLVEAWLPSLVILENVRGLGHRRAADKGKVPLDSVNLGNVSSVKVVNL